MDDIIFSWIAGLLGVLAFDFGTVCLGDFFSEKGKFLEVLPSWKGTKKFKIFKIIYNLIIFSNLIIWTILYFIFAINQEKKFIPLYWLSSIFGKDIILFVITRVLFLIEKNREEKRKKTLNFKI